MPFVAARCPQCGGEIQVDNQKDTGFCMHCGSKIIVQEAIKSVRIDNSQNIKNWIELGNMAEASGNTSEAYAYYTRVLEVKPDNWEIIYKRGKIAGGESTLINPRLLEAATAFATAIKIAPESEKSKIIPKASLELTALAIGYVNLRLDRFENWPDNDEKNGVIKDIEIARKAVKKFIEVSGVQITGYLESIAESICSSVYSAFNYKITPDYEGNDGHPGEYQFYEYLERIDRCIELINHAVSLSNEDYDNDIGGYEQLIRLEQAAINARSWEHVYYNYGVEQWEKRLQLTSSAIYSRQQEIKSYKTKIANLKANKAREEEKERQEKKRIREEEERKAKEEEIKKKEEKKKIQEEYFEAHPEERQAFLEKKKKISAEIEQLKTEKAGIEKTLNDTNEKIRNLRHEHEKLGIFAGKKKKEIESQISEYLNKTEPIKEQIKRITQEIKWYLEDLEK